MKKLQVIGVCSALALVAIGGAYAVANASTGTTDSTHSFTVIRKMTHLERQQADQDKTSVGDRFEFTSKVIKNGDVIGHQAAVCTVVFVLPNGDDSLLCVGTWALPGGMITSQAYRAAGGQGSSVAITGGTGIYQRVRGQIVEGDVLSGDRVEYTFELS